VIAICVITLPQIISEVWGYMSKDVGYVWVINMLIAIVVAMIIANVTQFKDGIRIALAIVTFVIVAIACECIIWHPSEISALISSKVTVKEAMWAVLGLVVSIVAYALQMWSGRNKTSAE